MKNFSATRFQSGMSLIELMIAMTIGLLIMAGLANLFVQSRQSFRQDNMVSRMQEDARFAMNQLSSDITMAGFFGPMVPNQIGNTGASVPANAPFLTYANPMFTLDNVTGAVAFDWTAALDDAVVGTDAISVRRVEGDTSATPLTSGLYYLETNGQTGNMIAGADGPSGLSNPEFWQYVPSIWYIRSWCRTGDGIPSLVRRYIDETGTVTDCIAAGIEDLQVELGLDSDGDLVPESYQSTALTAANAQDVAFVRIHLLSRAATADRQYTNTHTYNIANSGAYQPNDQFYRRVYTTTVQTRNPTGFRALSYQPPAN